jgi:hypothetical protein
MNLDLADVAYDYDDFEDDDEDDEDDFDDDDNAFECDRSKEQTPSGRLPAVASAAAAAVASAANQDEAGVHSQARRRRRQVGASSVANERTRRQISSSSDCGFSSASQNSMNLTNSNPSYSPTKFSEEEQRRLAQIYKRLATRLASTGGNGAAAGQHRDSATSEDLFRLKRALIEIHSESCCQNTRCASPHNCRNSSVGASDAQPPPPPTAEPPQSNLDSTEPLKASQPIDERDEARRSVTELKTTTVLNDSFADEPKRELARAFELKLTLSINPDPTTTSTSNKVAVPLASAKMVPSDKAFSERLPKAAVEHASRLSMATADGPLGSRRSG